MKMFSAPAALLESDDLSGFCSGQQMVDTWARERAHRASRQGTAVVYLSKAGDVPAGFYSLSAHSVQRSEVAGGWLKRNVPEQIPAVLLGMLGVDEKYQGMGLDCYLLRDAILRSRIVSHEIGARALLVDPADARAEGFYKKYGFRELPGTERLFLLLV